MVALVTTVMAFVYPNVSKIYDNYKNQALYYDQTEDIYALIAFKDAYEDELREKAKNVSEKCIDLFDNFNVPVALDDYLDSAYLCKYIGSNSPNENYNFKKYFKRMKKTTYDTDSYRIIGVFKAKVNGTDSTRYASIKFN